MSTADFLGGKYTAEDEEQDGDAGSGEEGSEDERGVDLMGNNTGDEDSSEEEDDDSEEEREIAKGFIEDEDESRKRRKKKRRKHRGGEDGSSRKRRKDSDDGWQTDAGDLDEDDLALLEENTGVKLTGRSSSGHKLKRLRRRRSASQDSDASPRGGLNNIFDDEEERNDMDLDTGNLFDADEMAGFIEDDTASESSGRHGSDSEEDEEERRERRKRKKEKKKQKSRPKKRSGFGLAGVEGITAEAWQEVTDVFGNGQDYAEALEDDSAEKEDKELKDIFEPSEIAGRMMTEADESIRAFDIPERLQLASSGLPSFDLSEDGPAPFISESDLDEATTWMSTRISNRCSEYFLMKNFDGLPPLHDKFMEALRQAIIFLNVEFFEVPFIWRYRADYLVHFNQQTQENTVFLNQNELWKISSQSIKFRALVHRRKELRALFDQIGEEDEHFENVFDTLEAVEEVADLQDWLGLRYHSQIDEIKARKLAEEGETGITRVKRATRESQYRKAKKNVVSKLAERVGVSAVELSQDFIAQSKSHYPDDPNVGPMELAEEFAGTEEYPTAASALEAAKMIIVTEISKDPMIKKEVRRNLKEYGVVSVRPTEKGLPKIDEMHPFYAFKYLERKPIGSLLRSHQFLQIISAEQEGLVISSITMPEQAREKILSDLKKVYLSDYTSSVAEQWNALRTEVLESAVKDLLASADSWVRSSIVEEEEDYIGKQCAFRLDSRINVAPFCRSDGSMEQGDVPSVLAISHGSGDPKRDSVICAFLDSEGYHREHLKLDRINPEPIFGEGEHAERARNERAAFVDVLRRRRPQVIVIGGFSANTKRLMDDVRVIANEVSTSILQDGDDIDEEEQLSYDVREQRARFEIIYVYDDVARIYQNSKRASVEFPELSTLGRYCVALARYAQSPLNEYAALGNDLTAVTYDPNQKLLSSERIMSHLERTLVEVTNKVGVDINRAIRDSYYYTLLPYVSGLGPRKAAALVKSINTVGGGTLSFRNQLIMQSLLTNQIFNNCVGFLRIPQDDLAADLGRRDDDEGDILDDTRIHPEDYEVARKMAADAMELDEEDIATLKTPSQAVADVMEEGAHKLDELSLDDFANELVKILHAPKRLALYAMRDEIQSPFGDSRPQFVIPTPTDVFTMLTGENKSTLDFGFIIPVRVVRVRKDGAVQVRLDSGVDGLIPSNYLTDDGDPSGADRAKPGSTMQALVMGLNHEAFEIELSSQQRVIANGDAERRRVQPDQWFDRQEAEDAKERQQVVQRKGANQRRRIIQHPNFHNFTSGEAELHLAHLPRGSAVIRPSSRDGYLAVTWKIEEGVYQHFAVMELNKANEYSLGGILRVDGLSKYQYSDLDELLESHVKAMAKKVEEMLAHEKYKGDAAALNTYLANFTMANPGKSAYGFALADKTTHKDAQFVVSFRRNHLDTESMSWPIRVVPGSFVFLGEEHGSVMGVQNALKIYYSANVGKGDPNLPARTPYYGGGRTPMVPGGGRTPMVQGGGRTPNPNMRGGATPLQRGGATPNPYAQNDPRNYPHQQPQATYAGQPPAGRGYGQQGGPPPPQGGYRAGY